MRAMPFGRSAVYDPDTLKTIGESFDSAWASIAHNFKGRFRDPARMRLATVILELAADGDCDPLELKCRAIGAMRLPLAA
jgi:hypothetical protein